MIYTLTLNPALDRELVVPEFAFDAILHAGARRIDYGGKGFNVSRALKALGTESIALGLVGGPTGERIAHGLDETNISSDLVWISGETRTNISIVNADSTHYLKVNEPGPIIAPLEMYTIYQKICKMARPGDWWVISGSLPQGIPEALYPELINIIQEADGRAVLDTDGPALRMGCEAAPYLVKPNRAEAERLADHPIESREDAKAALRVIHTLGPRHIALSLGADGALFSDGQQVWYAEPPTIQERNPIGAGDAMVAGMVWARSRDEAWPEALRWGVACGALAASLGGTAMGSRADVRILSEHVRVKLV